MRGAGSSDEAILAKLTFAVYGIQPQKVNWDDAAAQLPVLQEESEKGRFLQQKLSPCKRRQNPIIRHLQARMLLLF